MFTYEVKVNFLLIEKSFFENFHFWWRIFSSKFYTSGDSTRPKLTGKVHIRLGIWTMWIFYFIRKRIFDTFFHYNEIENCNFLQKRSCQDLIEGSSNYVVPIPFKPTQSQVVLNSFCSGVILTHCQKSGGVTPNMCLTGTEDATIERQLHFWNTECLYCPNINSSFGQSSGKWPFWFFSWKTFFWIDVHVVNLPFSKIQYREFCNNMPEDYLKNWTVESLGI